MGGVTWMESYEIGMAIFYALDAAAANHAME
jgi:hypothetical protein